MRRPFAALALTVAALVVLPALADDKKEEKAGPSLLFTEQDRVELENTEGMIDLNGTWTVEMWVKFDKGTQHFVGDESWKGEGGSAVGAKVEKPSGWVLRMLDDRKLDLNLAEAKKGWLSVKGAVIKADDKFHHIAISKDEKTLRVFLDGKVYVTRAMKDAKLVNCPSNLFVGVRANAFADRATNFECRGFKVSSKQLYTKEFKPAAAFEKTDDTQVLLDFSAGKGESIADLSGNKHDGAINGARWRKE